MQEQEQVKQTLLIEGFLKDNHVQEIMEMSFKDYKENIYEDEEDY